MSSSGRLRGRKICDEGEEAAVARCFTRKFEKKFWFESGCISAAAVAVDSAKNCSALTGWVGAGWAGGLDR